MKPTLFEELLALGRFLEGELGKIPKVLLMTGSGENAIGEALEGPESLRFQDIPAMQRILEGKPPPKGHGRRLLKGKLGGEEIVVSQGRLHGYGGFKGPEIVLLQQALMLMGVEIICLSNAAGGASHQYKKGDLALIQDLCLLFCNNPLTGGNDKRLGPRNPPVAPMFSPNLRAYVHRMAKQAGINLSPHEADYFPTFGPQYDTPMDVRLANGCGATAIGMSTVPAAIAAAHMGVLRIGFTKITNMCPGYEPKGQNDEDKELDHSGVTDTGERITEEKLLPLLIAILPGLVEAAGNELMIPRSRPYARLRAEGFPGY